MWDIRTSQQLSSSAATMFVSTVMEKGPWTAMAISGMSGFANSPTHQITQAGRTLSPSMG